MSESLKNTVKNGMIWSAVERFSVQGVQFFIMIVMARLLSPSDYGLIGMLAIFLSLSQSLIDSGFSQALIRKQDRTDIDYNTVFYFNIGIGFVLYLLLYIAAPFVATFYNTPELCSVMRVVCLGIFINSLAVVQRAVLTVQIDFKTQAKASLIATIISGIVGISLAYLNYGVWALAFQQLLNLSINTFLLWIMSSWHPRWLFSWSSFKELFSFGSKLLASGVIDATYNNIYPIVIGKIFSVNQLGYFTRAQHFSQFPSSNITGILQRVSYPVLCSVQNDDEHLSQVYRKFLRLSAFVVFPLMLGLAALAKPLIITTIGYKWSYCAELLQIISFGMMLYPIHAINLNLLQVKGRSDLFLRLEIIKKLIGISVLFIFIPLGLKAMCYGLVLSSIVALIINTYYTGKLIGVGFFIQIRDILPTFLLSLIMYIIVFGLQYIIVSFYAQLMIGIPLGVFIFCLLSKIFHFSEQKEIISIIKKS